MSRFLSRSDLLQTPCGKIAQQRDFSCFTLVPCNNYCSLNTHIIMLLILFCSFVDAIFLLVVMLHILKGKRLLIPVWASVSTLTNTSELRRHWTTSCWTTSCWTRPVHHHRFKPPQFDLENQPSPALLRPAQLLQSGSANIS